MYVKIANCLKKTALLPTLSLKCHSLCGLYISRVEQHLVGWRPRSGRKKAYLEWRKKNGLINLSYTFLIYGGINIGSKDRAPESDDKGTLFSESIC